MPTDYHMHVFEGSATKHFCNKLDTFHRQSCNGLAMWGHAKHGTDLESIPMHTNKRLITDKLSKLLVGAFLNMQADCVVKLKTEQSSSIEMFYYDFKQQIYLVQVVMDYPSIDRFMFEVYPLEGDLSIPHINLFWVL
mgnify:FL=1